MRSAVAVAGAVVAWRVVRRGGGPTPGPAGAVPGSGREQASPEQDPGHIRARAAVGAPVTVVRPDGSVDEVGTVAPDPVVGVVASPLPAAAAPPVVVAKSGRVTRAPRARGGRRRLVITWAMLPLALAGATAAAIAVVRPLDPVAPAFAAAGLSMAVVAALVARLARPRTPR